MGIEVLFLFCKGRVMDEHGEQGSASSTAWLRELYQYSLASKLSKLIFCL